MNTGGLSTNTRYQDFGGSPSHVYMVRAVKLEQAPTGTYHNASQGIVAADF